MLGTEYNIPTSVQSIASMAFKRNQEIEKVNIADPGVITIAYRLQ